MAETIKCPSCGFESTSTAKRCACGLSLVAVSPKSEIDYLKSLDASLTTIKNIMLWWLVLSIAATVLYVFAKVF